jgi:hypothetical protein
MVGDFDISAIGFGDYVYNWFVETAAKWKLFA